MGNRKEATELLRRADQQAMSGVGIHESIEMSTRGGFVTTWRRGRQSWVRTIRAWQRGRTWLRLFRRGQWPRGSLDEKQRRFVCSAGGGGPRR